MPNTPKIGASLVNVHTLLLDVARLPRFQSCPCLALSLCDSIQDCFASRLKGPTSVVNGRIEKADSETRLLKTAAMKDRVNAGSPCSIPGVQIGPANGETAPA